LLAALSMLATGDSLRSERQDEWAQIREKFNTYSDGESCHRILLEMAGQVSDFAFLKIESGPSRTGNG
jgi:hypothetical protein